MNSPIQIGDQWLCAVTDEEGNFLINPAAPLTWGNPTGPPVPNAFMPPTEIFNPTVPNARRLGPVGRVGAAVIRTLGVDSMPRWFPLLLIGNVGLAILIAFLLR